jgi:hypothetical protein
MEIEEREEKMEETKEEEKLYKCLGCGKKSMRVFNNGPGVLGMSFNCPECGYWGTPFGPF